MIIRFSEYIKENAESGIFSIKKDGNDLVCKLYTTYTNNGLEVYLMVDSKVFDNLSIALPDSTKLRRGEFFLNPKIDENIVKTLEEQNFITKQTLTSLAGDEESYAYKLNISDD